MSIRILVVVHNASPGTPTMELASHWASRLGGSVVGLGVVDESTALPAPMVAGGAAGMGGIVMSDNEALRAKADKAVAEALRELGKQCEEKGVSYRDSQQSGVPQECVLLEAQRHDVVLLGRPATPDPDFGIPARTIFEDILRNSPRPVVAVPGHIQTGEGILVAYDGSLQAARALQALVASGLAALGPITVLGAHCDCEDTARDHANRAIDYLAIHGAQAESRAVVSDKSVEKVIVEEARNGGVQLIVMGAYGRSRLIEFFVGSTTAKVLDESPAPIFLFH